MATVTLAGGSRDGGTVTTADPAPQVLAFVLATQKVIQSGDGLKTDAVISELYGLTGPTTYRFTGTAPPWLLPAGAGTAVSISGVQDEAAHVATDEAGASLLGEAGT